LIAGGGCYIRPELIAKVSEKSQIIVVSHAMPLVDSLAAVNGSVVYTLKKELGETVVPDREASAWAWPKR
jgi:predicted ATPase